MPDLIEMIVLMFYKLAGPNTEADEKSAYNNVQVGERGLNIENFKRNSTDNAGWEQRNKFYENIISIPLLRITT